MSTERGPSSFDADNAARLSRRLNGEPHFAPIPVPGVQQPEPPADLASSLLESDDLFIQWGTSGTHGHGYVSKVSGMWEAKYWDWKAKAYRTFESANLWNAVKFARHG